jgi:hypothetical protein
VGIKWSRRVKNWSEKAKNGQKSLKIVKRIQQVIVNDRKYSEMATT